jgi:hypothetical protein
VLCRTRGIVLFDNLLLLDLAVDHVARSHLAPDVVQIDARLDQSTIS